jgi:hypothetical protein
MPKLPKIADIENQLYRGCTQIKPKTLPRMNTDDADQEMPVVTKIAFPISRNDGDLAQ